MVHSSLDLSTACRLGYVDAVKAMTCGASFSYASITPDVLRMAAGASTMFDPKGDCLIEIIKCIRSHKGLVQCNIQLSDVADAFLYAAEVDNQFQMHTLLEYFPALGGEELGLGIRAARITCETFAYNSLRYLCIMGMVDIVDNIETITGWINVHTPPGQHFASKVIDLYHDHVHTSSVRGTYACKRTMIPSCEGKRSRR